MASKPFAIQNEGQALLMLALTGQKFGRLPSQLLGLDDEVVALDFDMAAAWKLQEFEDQREECLRLKTAAAMWGETKPEIEWESVPM